MPLGQELIAAYNLTHERVSHDLRLAQIAEADAARHLGGGGHVCEAQDSTGGMLGMATLREVTSILYRVERAHWAYQDDVLVRNPALQDLSFQTFTTLLVSQVPDHLLVLRLFRMHSPRVDICLVL